MCGITARIGRGDGLEKILSGLENLEYRGYDSTGVAVANGRGIDVVKREGEISLLKRRIRRELDGGAAGIGHTRWSTHGAPTDANAHPHCSCDGRVAVVHNGIVENHVELRAELEAAGHEFTSETDTEVIPHLIEAELDAGASPDVAFRRAVERLEGRLAFAAIVDGTKAIYATRRGSPLVVGLNGTEYFVASDVPAFLEYTDEVVFLEDGDVAVLTPDGVRTTTLDGGPVDRPRRSIEWMPEDARRKGYTHYMLKEINEQPMALERTVHGRVDPDGEAVTFEGLPPETFAAVESVHFVGCGTSYYAGLYAREVCHEREIPAGVYRAGEYVTNPPPIDERSLVVAVTQSGETADTLEALRRASERGARTLAVTNVVGSTVTRECDDAVFIRAGPEIGVAATKTFSSQVATLTMLVERLKYDLTGSYSEDVGALSTALVDLPDDLDRVLDETTAARVAREVANRDAYFFIGRGVGYPVAREGALKFKEITYEHAEGFAAGQLKHGPLALVTSETPVFAIFTGRHETHMAKNVEEIKARGAPVVGVMPRSSPVADAVDHVLPIPETHPTLAGVLANVNLQLVSYHVADRLGRSIDKPRNLAKSVTVE